MMREVLERRFKRLMNEHPRDGQPDVTALADPQAAGSARCCPTMTATTRPGPIWS